MLVIYYAMSAIIGPFVGQNVSSGKADRIYLALRLCTLFCLASGLVIALALAASSTFLPSLFSDNPAVTRVATTFLLIAPLGYGAYGMVMVMNAAFNGMGKPIPGVWISLMRLAALYLPLAFIADRFFGVTGIFAAYTVANIVTGVAAYAWARSAVQSQVDKHGPRIMAAETL